jgi:hypothetical protein
MLWLSGLPKSWARVRKPMTPELEAELLRKYPKIFSRLTYIECGDGWYDLIDRLCSAIQMHVDSKRHMHSSLTDEQFDEEMGVTADQVKEKWGGLRFYASGADEWIDGAVSMAEKVSFCTCEVCGGKGRRSGGAWVRTLCDEHSKS